jgi:prepilin-type processing-associated H-X9-DG protein
MAIDAILRWALIVLGSLTLMVAGIGFMLGARASDWRKPGGAIACTSFVLYLLLIGGSAPLAQKFGPIVTKRASIVLTCLVAGMVGGFGAGIKSRRKQAPGMALYVLVTGVVVAYSLMQFWSDNQQVKSAATELGLDKPRNTAPQQASAVSCPENLKHLYAALAEYASDWDGLPPAKAWMDCIDTDEFATVKAHPEWLRCPEAPASAGFGYAMNRSAVSGKLGGKALNALPNAAKTPLLYDSSDTGRNASDAFTSLPKPGRHRGKNYILYLDGHVDLVALN